MADYPQIIPELAVLLRSQLHLSYVHHAGRLSRPQQPMAGKSQGSSERSREDVSHRYASQVRAHVQGKNEAYQRIQLLFDQAMEIYAHGLPDDYHQDIVMTPSSSDAKKLIRTIRRVEDTESNDDDDKSRSLSENLTELSSCGSSSDCLKSGCEAENVPSTFSKVPPTANTLSKRCSQLENGHKANFIPPEKAMPSNLPLFQTQERRESALFIPETSSTSPAASSRIELFHGDYQHGKLPSENPRAGSAPKISVSSIPGVNVSDGTQRPKSSLSSYRIHQGKSDVESKLKFLETFFQVSPSKSFHSPSRKPGGTRDSSTGEVNSSPQSSVNRTTQDHHHIFRITKPLHLVQKFPKSSISARLKHAPSKSPSKSSQLSTKSASKSEVPRNSGSRPRSAPKVPFYERFDLTVPIPFDLTPSHRRNNQSQAVEKPSRIHTHPVPLSSQLPLYDPEWEEAERQRRRQARMEEVISKQRPFHLHSTPRSTNLHKTTSMPNLRPKPIKLPSQRDYTLEMAQQEELRKQQIQWRSEELLSLAKVPFSSNRHQQLVAKKYSRPPSTKPRPSSARWAKTTTVPQPFNLTQQQYCQQFLRSLAPKIKSAPSSPKRPMSATKKTSIKLNQATALRNQAIRKRMSKQAEETTKLRKMEVERKRKEADRMQNLALIIQAQGLEATAESDKMLRIREMKLEEACKEEEYYQFLEDMQRRVEARPYILEQLSMPQSHKNPHLRSKPTRDNPEETIQTEELEEKMKLLMS